MVAAWTMGRLTPTPPSLPRPGGPSPGPSAPAGAPPTPTPSPPPPAQPHPLLDPNPQVSLARRFQGPGYTFLLAGFLKIMTLGGLAASAPQDVSRTAFGKASGYLLVPVGLGMAWAAKQVRGCYVCVCYASGRRGGGARVWPRSPQA